MSSLLPAALRVRTGDWRRAPAAPAAAGGAVPADEPFPPPPPAATQDVPRHGPSRLRRAHLRESRPVAGDRGQRAGLLLATGLRPPRADVAGSQGHRLSRSL